MPWLSLTSTKTIRFQTVVHAPLDEVVAFLHSPSELIDLNPLVERKLVSEDDPLFYTITDKLNFLGWSFETRFTAQFTLQENGTDSVICAPAGTKLFNVWRARTIEGHSVETPLVEVSEEVAVEVNISHFLTYTCAILIESPNIYLGKYFTFAIHYFKLEIRSYCYLRKARSESGRSFRGWERRYRTRRRSFLQSHCMHLNALIGRGVCIHPLVGTDATYASSRADCLGDSVVLWYF